ncbi:MAG: hypothetical protein EBU46_20180 [Nitrosomonadaceae bacterium]|nr:hypothetical protein [Nitrosomonadaceae bacterium]
MSRPASMNYRRLPFYIGYEAAINGEQSQAGQFKGHERRCYTNGFTEGQQQRAWVKRKLRKGRVLPKNARLAQW